MQVFNNTLKLPLFILLTFLLSNCSLLETDLDGTLSTKIGVTESKDDANIIYSNTTVLSADSDDDIKDNLDKVKGWNVNELSYSIWSYEGDPNSTFTGTIGFSKRDANTAEIQAAVSNLKMEDVSGDNKKYKLNLTETQLHTIAGYFDTDQAIKVYFEGTLSQGPVNFDVEVFAKVKITAKVL